jgi:putative membrane protein
MHQLTIALLAAAGAWYAVGLHRLWIRAGAGRGVAYWRASSFFCGLAVLAAALVGLHHEAERALWVHMVQHELVMALAAPLIVLGRPLEACTWALKPAWRRKVRLPRLLSDAGFGWALHAGAIWGWHVPALFALALANPWMHYAQHASFFGTALLFWWSVLSQRQLASIISLFTTMLHTGALGALMTLARAPWYAGFALEDQQLAGLVMWVPAGLAYPIAALFVGSQWFRRSAA